jgi:hypothetical protein
VAISWGQRLSACCTPRVAQFADDLDGERGSRQLVMQRLVLAGGELLAGRRHEELEHPPAPAADGVVIQPFQGGGLRCTQPGGVGRVEAHQRLDPVGAESLDVRGEVVAVLERKLLRAAGFGRHGQLEACLPGVPGDIGAELLVHQDAEAAAAERHATGPLGAGEDQLLGTAHGSELFAGRLALDAEQRAEGITLVHRHDEQRLRGRRWPGDVGHGARLPQIGR